MSKKTIAILKSFFETGDRPTEQQFADLIDSFHHKDTGRIVVNRVFENETGKVRFEFDDASAFEFTVPQSAEISFINGLSAALNNKVDKVSGKGLSTLDFTSAKSADITANKAHAANADIHVTAEQKTSWDNKVDPVAGKGLSTNDYDDEAAQKVAGFDTHINNADIHVTANDKIKWTNRFQDFKTSEELTAEMGRIYRIYDNSIYRYDGLLPFVTLSYPQTSGDNLWTKTLDLDVAIGQAEHIRKDNNEGGSIILDRIADDYSDIATIIGSKTGPFFLIKTISSGGAPLMAIKKADSARFYFSDSTLVFRNLGTGFVRKTLDYRVTFEDLYIDYEDADFIVYSARSRSYSSSDFPSSTNETSLTVTKKTPKSTGENFADVANGGSYGVVRLLNPHGTYYNYLTPCARVRYKVDYLGTPLAIAVIKINVSQADLDAAYESEPVIIDSTKIAGSPFVAGVDMELVIECPDGRNLRHYFVEL